MEILDAKWTPKINILLIRCECGNIISHRADRWQVYCHKCQNKENLSLIRQKYVYKNLKEGEK